MTRVYSHFCNNDIHIWLEILADKTIESRLYKKTMTQLGSSLGECILSQINDEESNVYLASTVEDADFLAKGMLTSLENRLSKLAFACFWNQVFPPFEVEYLKVAPIFKKYQEPTEKTVSYLIVVKSMISDVCVVRTNLVNIIQTIEPENIFIAAPVIYYNAEEKLKNEFEEDIYQKFKFFYFAKDTERTPEGEVIPGIGGNVYTRLGFANQDDKNQYIPEIVKQRRANFLHSNNALGKDTTSQYISS